MEFFTFNPATFTSFLLTLFRVSLVLFLLPFFGGTGIPKTVKAALCIVLSLAIYPRLSFPGGLFPGHPLNLAIMLLGELVLGMVLGLVVHFVFAAIRTGGQLVGFQMGFAMVNVVDPDTGASEAVTAHFLYMIALLTFLTLDGHLYLLRALTLSFNIVPPGGLLISSGLTESVLEMSGVLFTLAVRIAAPVMAALFLVDLALALVGRAAPQMNILMLGFPVKISVGFFFLGLIFNMLALYMKDFIVRMDGLFGLLLSLAS